MSLRDVINRNFSRLSSVYWRIRSYNQDLQELEKSGVDGRLYLPDQVLKWGSRSLGFCPTEGRRGLPVLETNDQPELLEAIPTASHGALFTSGVERGVAAMA